MKLVLCEIWNFDEFGNKQAVLGFVNTCASSVVICTHCVDVM